MTANLPFADEAILANLGCWSNIELVFRLLAAQIEAGPPLYNGAQISQNLIVRWLLNHKLDREILMLSIAEAKLEFANNLASEFSAV